MTAQVAADLRAAADVLRRDGWTQSAYKSHCGRCVTGALISVATDGAGSSPSFLSGGAYPRFQSARDAIAEMVGDWFLAAWNDEPGRTADEVIAALEAAADAAEAQS